MTATDSATAMMQRRDDEYYARSRAGYGVTTGERDAAALQRYAAKRSKETRRALFGEGLTDGGA